MLAAPQIGRSYTSIIMWKASPGWEGLGYVTVFHTCTSVACPQSLHVQSKACKQAGRAARRVTCSRACLGDGVLLALNLLWCQRTEDLCGAVDVLLRDLDSQLCPAGYIGKGCWHQPTRCVSTLSSCAKLWHGRSPVHGVLVRKLDLVRDDDRNATHHHALFVRDHTTTNL